MISDKEWAATAGTSYAPSAPSGKYYYNSLSKTHVLSPGAGETVFTYVPELPPASKPQLRYYAHQEQVFQLSEGKLVHVAYTRSSGEADKLAAKLNGL
jgi:hypothetical protein